VITDDKGEPVLVWQSTVRIHDLRHTHASILVNLGLSLPIIGKLLGHTQALTTHRHAHLQDDPLRACGFAAQQTEAAIGVAVLNRMLVAGRPDSVRHHPVTAKKLGVGAISPAVWKCTNAESDRMLAGAVEADHRDVSFVSFGLAPEHIAEETCEKIWR
jgi:hypothetical protein